MQTLSHRIAAIALGIGIFSLAFVLRFEASRDELWIDEYITAWTVTESWNETWRRADIGNQAALYHGILLSLAKVFGESPLAFRGFSLGCGLGVVLLSGWFAYRLTSSRTAGFLASYLACLDQQFVFYASEARAYALVQLLGLAAAFVAWKLNFDDDEREVPIQARRTRWTATFFVLIAATFYAHYSSLLAILVLVGSSTVFQHFRGRWLSFWWLGLVITALTCLPGFVALLRIAQRAEDWQLFSSLSLLAQSLLGRELLVYFVPAIVALVFSLRGRHTAIGRIRRAILFLVTFCGGTIAIVVLATVSQLAPLGHYRYLMAATGVFPVIGACWIVIWSTSGRRMIAALSIAILASVLTPVGRDWHRGTLQRPLRYELWTQIADRIDAESSKQLPLIVLPNLIEDYQIPGSRRRPDCSYFWAPFEVLGRPKQIRLIWAAPTFDQPRFDETMLDELHMAGGAWLVIRGGPSLDDPGGGEIVSSVLAELNHNEDLTFSQWTCERLGPIGSDVQLFELVWR